MHPLLKNRSSVRAEVFSFFFIPASSRMLVHRGGRNICEGQDGFGHSAPTSQECSGDTGAHIAKASSRDGYGYYCASCGVSQGLCSNQDTFSGIAVELRRGLLCNKDEQELKWEDQPWIIPEEGGAGCTVLKLKENKGKTKIVCRYANL